MCLIIYSPQGVAVEADYWYEANRDNSDGIGVMSREGVERFMGKGQAKQAYAYMLTLAARSIPFGAHFRWRTHGARDISQVHPHKIEGRDVYVMHNGVLSGYNYKGAQDVCESDTALFCRDVLAPVLTNTGANIADLVPLVEYAIGYSNKFLAYDMARDQFALFNEYCGTWNEAHTLWSSNEYSMPGKAMFGFPKHDSYNTKFYREHPGIVVTSEPVVDADLVAAATMREVWDKKFCEDTFRQRIADKKPTLADFNYDESEYAMHLNVNEHMDETEAWEQAEYELDLATEPIAAPKEAWSSYLSDMCAQCGLRDELQIQACCGNQCEYVTPSSVIANEIANERKPILLLPNAAKDKAS